MACFSGQEDNLMLPSKICCFQSSKNNIAVFWARELCNLISLYNVEEIIACFFGFERDFLQNVGNHTPDFMLAQSWIKQYELP